MSISVTKSTPEVVCPSKPTPVGGFISLSSFDKSLAGFSVTSYLVFEHPIDNPAKNIKRALAEALVHYYPIAGRLASSAAGDGNGDLSIACTNEGVQFVAASASCTLADAGLVDSPFTAALATDLAVDPSPASGGGCRRRADPLLSMQVTEFSCGGFVVGTTSDHAVADGEGMAQFMTAVGELARGMPRPTVTPTRCDADSVLADTSPFVAASNRWLMGLDHDDMAFLDITVPASVIGRVRAGYLSSKRSPSDADAQISCTVVEAAMAVLWQCRARAVTTAGAGADDPDAPMPLLFAANLRRHVGVGDGYYGNCFGMQAVPATRSEITDSHVNHVVELIKRAKEKIPEMSCKAGNGGSPATTSWGAGVAGYDVFIVSSWRGVGLDAVDLGSGAPARVMWHGHRSIPSSVLCPPRRRREEDDDGVNVLARCVKQEHVDAFLGELARFNQ
ncbi:hypothetical protein ACP4OV_005369 [Aristida adscensionis]